MGRVSACRRLCVDRIPLFKKVWVTRLFDDYSTILISFEYGKKHPCISAQCVDAPGVAPDAFDDFIRNHERSLNASTVARIRFAASATVLRTSLKKQLLSLEPIDRFQKDCQFAPLV